MIRTVDEISESGGGNAGNIGRAVGEIAAPVTAKIPIGAGDVSHVDVNHHAELFGSHARFLNAAVAEAKAPAHGADDAVFNLSGALRGTSFSIERISIGKSDDDGVILGIAGGFGEMTVFDTIGREKSKLSDFEFAGRSDDVADGGRIGDRNDIEFSDVGIAAEANAVRGHIVGRRLNDRELHAFLKIGITAGIDVNGRVSEVFHTKDGGFLGGRRGLRERTRRKESEKEAGGNNLRPDRR